MCAIALVLVVLIGPQVGLLLLKLAHNLPPPRLNQLHPAAGSDLQQLFDLGQGSLQTLSRQGSPTIPLQVSSQFFVVDQIQIRI